MAHTRSSSQPVLTLGVGNGACRQASERDSEVEQGSRGPEPLYWLLS